MADSKNGAGLTAEEVKEKINDIRSRTPEERRKMAREAVQNARRGLAIALTHFIESGDYAATIPLMRSLEALVGFEDTLSDAVASKRDTVSE